MHKIHTIFDRDWEGNRGVVPRLVVNPGGAVATEKLDGTNVRVTVRHGEAVRLEKRRNPDKAMKARGIDEPWYVDANMDPEANGDDRWIADALDHTNVCRVPDGEWSAEAVGPKIQGNPLLLEYHQLFFLDRGGVGGRRAGVPVVPVLEDAPVQRVGDLFAADFFAEVREYLHTRRSMVNPCAPVEGIVWHGDIEWAKIKRKDFKP